MTTTTPTTSIAKAVTFPDMLVKFKDQIGMALPKHLNPDRMVRIALTEYRKNEELAKCDPVSIFASIIMASQLGLEPGVMGQAYLVPFKDKDKGMVCTLIPGWQGYADLVSRSGRASVWTNAVHAGDLFEYELGTHPKITHQPGDDSDDDSPFTHVYSVGWIKDAQWPVIEIWSRKKVDKHLKRYNRIGNGHYALKQKDGELLNFEMYGRKVALLQVIKYMPKSVELQVAANLDLAAQAGGQIIDLKDAVSGTFTYTDNASSSTQPEIPAEMKELAAQLKWNDAQLWDELGRNQNDVPKLLAQMKEQLAKTTQLSSAPRAESSPVSGTTTQQTKRSSSKQGDLPIKEF